MVDTIRWRRLKLVFLYAIFVVPLSFAGYASTRLMFASPVPLKGAVLAVDKTVYKPGDIVTFTIANKGKEAVYVANHCPSEPLSVYRLAGSSWQQVHEQTAENKCVDQQRGYTIAPGSTVSGTYAYWPNLFKTPGHYKVQADITGDQGQPSVEFDVVN